VAARPFTQADDRQVKQVEPANVHAPVSTKLPATECTTQRPMTLPSSPSMFEGPSVVDSNPRSMGDELQPHASARPSHIIPQGSLMSISRFAAQLQGVASNHAQLFSPIPDAERPFTQSDDGCLEQVESGERHSPVSTKLPAVFCTTQRPLVFNSHGMASNQEQTLSPIPEAARPFTQADDGCLEQAEPSATHSPVSRKLPPLFCTAQRPAVINCVCRIVPARGA
jgi:hypothetical protein